MGHQLNHQTHLLLVTSFTQIVAFFARLDLCMIEVERSILLFHEVVSFGLWWFRRPLLADFGCSDAFCRSSGFDIVFSTLLQLFALVPFSLDRVESVDFLAGAKGKDGL